MLAKLTRGNQVTIPKPVIEQAKLKVGRDYLRVLYVKGLIILSPVEVRDRVHPRTTRRVATTLSRAARRRA